MNCHVTGKIRFYSFRSASKHAAQLARKCGRKVRVYRCEFCHFYHMTTSKWTNLK